MSSFTQDLPPKEGYRPFQIDRIPLRTLIRGRTAIILCTVATVVGHGIHALDWMQYTRDRIETLCGTLALRPILLAERDRAYLKQVKRNVEEEKELMKYIPAWKIGTYYGDPIYKTVGENELVRVTRGELNCHSDGTYDSKEIAYFYIVGAPLFAD